VLGAALSLEKNYQQLIVRVTSEETIADYWSTVAVSKDYCY
jgi:hypothetical protein